MAEYKEIKQDSIKEPVNDYYDQYEYGKTQEQLTPGIEVKNPSSNSDSGVKILSFTKESGTGTGVTNYTGFGFNPSSYVVEAWRTDGGPIGTSYQSYIGGTLAGNYIHESAGSLQIQDLGTRVVCVYNETGNNTRANHSAIITDGVAFDFISDSVDVKFTITAYS